MSARILVLSTYPAVDPAHGGQKRTLAIARAYRTAGFAVVQTAVFCARHYATWSETDIPVSLEFEEQILREPLTGDVLCGRAMTDDVPTRRALEALLRTFEPDAVHIEQPYLYPGLRRLLQELGQSPKLIFGSQNIESPMKRDILADVGWTPERVEEYCAGIHALEQEFSRDCDLLAACTAADLRTHVEFGARRAVLAPNGIERVHALAGGADQLDVAPEIEGKKVALFIGSGHRPNMVGFRELIGVDAGFLPAGARLVAVGGVCTTIRNLLQEDLAAVPADRRPVLAGRVSEAQLRDLIERADVLLLPISIGGGSNLKTAEAIAADRKIVTTSSALRSYEWFADFPNVWVADTKSSFQDGIVRALGADWVPRSPEQREQASSVYWDNCLKDLLAAAEDLTASNVRPRELSA